MIDHYGQPTHHYDMVALVNRELQAMGDILIGKQNLGVFHVGGCPDTKTAPWPGAFGDITAMGAENLTVGCFEGGYTLLANKDYQCPIVASLTVKDGKCIEQYDKQSGEWRSLSPVSACYRIPIGAGDGHLIRTI